MDPNAVLNWEACNRLVDAQTRRQVIYDKVRDVRVMICSTVQPDKVYYVDWDDPNATLFVASPSAFHILSPLELLARQAD